MRTNLWKQIYKECNSGTMKDKMNNLIEFPRYVDIELTNTCNLGCIMCPTGRNLLIRPVGFMGHGMFIKILKECARYGCHVRFVRWGEPLLHPEVTKFMAMVKSSGLMCHINTNGMLLTDEVISRIISMKLDSIKFSFQGVDRDEYERFRKGGSWEQLLINISELYNRRYKKKQPYITVGSTVSKPDIEAIRHFTSKMLEIADEVSVGHTRNIINPEPNGRKPNCPEVFDKLSINWNGEVVACCSDWNNSMLLGNLEKSTLYDIWHGDNANYYRQMLVDGRHAELELCKSCYL